MLRAFLLYLLASALALGCSVALAVYTPPAYSDTCVEGGGCVVMTREALRTALTEAYARGRGEDDDAEVCFDR